MNILAIIKRELRVLCRKRSVYVVRTLFTAAILLTWACWQGLWEYSATNTLVVMSLIAMILFGMGGAIAPSDTISSERRNRTLGLLLLTPLQPLEVLFGKLFTCISQHLLCLVAILPVLALPLLGGGVEGSAVVRHFLGILAVSLLGMFIGLFASVLCRRAGASASFSFSTMFLLFLAPFFGEILYDSTSIDFIWGGPIGLPFHDIGGFEELGSWLLNITIILGLGLGFLLLATVLFPLIWHRERQANTGRKARKNPQKRRFVSIIGDRENPCHILRHRTGRLYPACSGLILLLCIASALWVFFVVEGFEDPADYLELSYLIGFFLLLPIVYWKCCLKTPLPPISCSSRECSI